MSKFTSNVILIFMAGVVVFYGCAPAPLAPSEVPSPIPLTDTPTPIPATLTPEATATQIPSPTTLPGLLVLPLDTLGSAIPWLPMDNTIRPSVSYVGFNTIKPPFNSALVRQAFSYAVDRDILVEMSQKYYGDIKLTPATTLTPPQTLGRDLYGVVGANFDPQKAKDLLNQAGYTDTSVFPTVVILVNASGEVAPGARFNRVSAMADMWQTHLGVTVEVQVVRSFSEYTNRLETNPPDLFWVSWIADYNDPANFVGEIFNPSGDYNGEINFGKFANEEFELLIVRARNTGKSPAERQELYIQAERILCETEAAIIPILHYVYNLN